MSGRFRAWWGFVFFAAGLAVYAAGAWRTPWMDRGTNDMLRVLARGRNIDAAAEEALARAYWERYPDVRASALYGEKGRLGILGAREHFTQHGRREGRVWGP
jgi:hypothetical protein